MLTRKMKENLMSFRRITVSPIDDPRQWIMDSVHKERPDMAYSNVVDQLMEHLSDFLSIDEIYQNLDLGGMHSCEVIFRGEPSIWCFEYKEDSPYHAILNLYEVRGAKKWSPPQT